MHDGTPPRRVHTPRLVPGEPASYLNQQDMAWVQPYSNLIDSTCATIQRELLLNAPRPPRDSNGVGPNGEVANKTQCLESLVAGMSQLNERFYLWEGGCIGDDFENSWLHVFLMQEEKAMSG